MKRNAAFLIIGLAALTACVRPGPDLGQRMALAASNPPIEFKLNVLDDQLNAWLDVQDVRFTETAGIIGLHIQWKNITDRDLTFSTQARWFAGGLLQETAGQGWLPVSVMRKDMAITTLMAPKSGVDRLELSIKIEGRKP